MMKFREYLDELLHADSIMDVLMENKKETVKLAAILVVVLMIVLLYMHQSDQPLVVEDPDGKAGSAQEQADRSGAGGANADAGAGSGASAGIDTDGIVYVDIDGAVKHPMLAELPTGSRVEDAIEAAGGLKKDADLTQVNRAALLTDGEKIYIPAEGETTSAGTASGGAASDGSGSAGTGSGAQLAGISGGKININTADVVLLQQLTGVGPVTAQKIVDYREQNGSFTAIEDLKKVSGIGEKTFEKMRDDVTI